MGVSSFKSHLIYARQKSFSKNAKQYLAYLIMHRI